MPSVHANRRSNAPNESRGRPVVLASLLLALLLGLVSAGTVELRRGERALLVLLPPFYRGSAEVQSRLLIDSPGSATRP